MANGAHPPRGFVRERGKGRIGALPEPRQEVDEHLERLLPQKRPRAAALDEKRVAFVVTRQQPHGAVAIPELERIRLVLALAMRPLDLEDDVTRGNDVRHEPALEALLELEIPLPGALVDQGRQALLPRRVYAGVGQRYASGRR